ncbi:MAG: aldehyde dehydrogenase family protein [Betaproteobacteria bacterium]|nr:aldehyde dehydrogenase family protein [Betaproteobacteria bacterium]
MHHGQPDIAITNLIIDGKWTAAQGESRYDICNPARPDELVGCAAMASREDVDRAVRAAHAAWPAWSKLSYAQRAAYLKQIADALVADQDELAARIRLFTREHGKILKECEIEMSRLGDRFRLAATYADRLGREEQLPGPPFDTLIGRQARGVAALIVPWNWPLSILGAKLPQALLAGNTAVVKLSPYSPLASAQTIRRMAQIVPPGVINLLTGTTIESGDALVSHPLVRKINFTGSVEVGKHVMAMAARNLAHVTLELGGNDPAIVLEDAELDAATIQRMVTATYMSAGQICMALKRLYVHESRYEELVSAFTAATARYVVGDGLDPRVTMGPVNNPRRHEAMRDMVAEARARGAEVREVGTIADEGVFARGYFHLPTVVLTSDHSLRVVREEQFAPVLPILPFRDEAEAIRLANDSELGLCSSVWTRDRERALRIARQLEAGYTYLNGHGALAQDFRAPFGGFKQSGIGRNLGYEGVLEFQEYHSVSAPQGWLF